MCRACFFTESLEWSCVFETSDLQSLLRKCITILPDPTERIILKVGTSLCFHSTFNGTIELLHSSQCSLCLAACSLSREMILSQFLQKNGIS
ncbi:hypothetical protein NPIL_496851 [Nephila pilipes]|uniref:Uncharacterized protein n=1 Tax=Nephila pilipes TaxID=299642 RepID=A0A8X6NW54_NEPPI|nr:hypothetical protein NPIL_496851 [Nephila pilipes]